MERRRAGAKPFGQKKLDERQPPVPVFRLALKNVKESFLDFLRDLAALAVADFDIVDFRDRSDLSRRARHKNFISERVCLPV